MQYVPTEHFVLNVTKTTGGEKNVPTTTGRSNNVCKMFMVCVLKNELLTTVTFKNSKQLLSCITVMKLKL